MLPYVSFPFSFAQPASMAAVASLFGHSAPQLTSARVLELGCASAGNLIPLAVRFPESHFVGVDISADEIALGARRVAEMRLKNIRLEVADIAAYSSSESFDFVIAHGVFSWVPHNVRGALLRLIGERLSADGLAVVSFNVLPGWRVRQIVRDIVLRTTGFGGPDHISKAWAGLSEIADGASESTPYGMALRGAVQRLSQQPPSYFEAEFLVPESEAFFFADFHSAARQFGLHYLAEADLTLARVDSALPPRQASEIHSLAERDPVSAQQRIDFILGRMFRRALLARRAGPSMPNPTALLALHASTGLRPNAGSPGVFTSPQGQAVRSPDVATTRALETLALAYPATVPIATLAANGADPLPFLSALLSLACSHVVRLSAVPLSVGRADDSRPCVFELARKEAAGGQTWVSNLEHRAAVLPQDILAALPAIDGTRTSGALGLTPAVLAQLEREALLIKRN